MVDRLVYTAMTGAKATMEQQATVSNNLANATTNGFRTQLNYFRSAPVVSEGYDTRAFVADWTAGANFEEGVLRETGRALDVAIHGKGWFAVQSPDGSEAYTRDGNFTVNENGILQTQTGLNVLGDGGIITAPPNSVVTVAADGTVSARALDADPNDDGVVGQIKLVNPDEKLLVRGDDTLFRLRTGEVAPADENVKVVTGMIEGSNVNVAEQMVNMINLSRQFELHMKMVQTAQTNDEKASQILAVS